jgi:antirestriction protein
MAVYAPNRQTIVPRVWIGCLACYNEGELVGHWYDAVDADHVLPSDLHGCPTDHEEMWCLDTENVPGGEMDPLTAARWGHVIESEVPMWRGAYLAWLDDQGITDPADAPTADGFSEILMGEWPTFEDFAEMIVQDTGMLDGVPESVSTYFDMESFARDLAYDYTVLDSPHGTVWVYQNQ